MTFRTLVIAIAAFPALALALPDVPEKPGWSGFVALGAGYTEIKSNTAAGNRLVDGGKDTISDINQPPESSDDFHPVPTGEVNWTLGRRNELFLGTSLEDAVAFDGAFQFGWRKQANLAGIFQLGILFSQLIPAEVWADPYLAGTPRNKIDRDSTGLRFQWDKIFGTRLEWTLSYRDIDIESEASGQNVAGCDAACQSLLVRDGNFYETRLSWVFNLGNGHILRPLVGYRRMDTKGDAVSYDAPMIQLTYSYLGGEKFSVVTNAVVGAKNFDKANPLYGVKQDSKNLKFDATLFYKLPTASRRWALFGAASWADLDSDINFHDNEFFNVSLGALYRFGDQPLVRKRKSSAN
jgi:hypothetical protein